MKTEEDSTHSFSSKRVEDFLRIKIEKSQRSSSPAPSFKKDYLSPLEQVKEFQWKEKVKQIRLAFNAVMLQCEKQTPHELSGGRLESLRYIQDSFLCSTMAEVVYVCGPPGTGKTAGVLKLCENEDLEYMNVMTYKTAQKWLRGLFEKMKKRGIIQKKEFSCSSEESILKVLQTAFEKESRIVVVVDEVDNFGNRELMKFTRMLETLAHYEGLRIIAIANTVNLLQEAISDVKFHQILCAQYTHQQSMEIVESRISYALLKDNLKQSQLFERDALRKLAMVMQRGEPDVRKLLQIIIEVSKLVVDRIEFQQLQFQEAELDSCQLPKALSQFRVKMDDMNDVLNQRYGSIVERIMSKIPKTTKIYAGMIARMSCKEKASFLKQEDTLIELNRFMKAFKLERVGAGALNDIITSLQFEGLLERFSKRIKGKNVQMIKMKMNISEVIEASEDIFKLWEI